MKRHITIFATVVALGVAGVVAQSGNTTNVEVRVWQRISDAESLFVSARPEGGSWLEFGTIPLDMAGRAGDYRFADIEISAPLPDTPYPHAFTCGREAVARVASASVVSVGQLRQNGDIAHISGNAFHIGGDEYLTSGHVVGDIIEKSAASVPSGALTLRDRASNISIGLRAPNGTWHVSAEVVGGFPFREGDVALLRVHARADGGVVSFGATYSSPPALHPRGWAGALIESETVAHAKAGEAPRWGEVEEIIDIHISGTDERFTSSPMVGGVSVAVTVRPGKRWPPMAGAEALYWTSAPALWESQWASGTMAHPCPWRNRR